MAEEQVAIPEGEQHLEDTSEEHAKAEEHEGAAEQPVNEHPEAGGV